MQSARRDRTLAERGGLRPFQTAAVAVAVIVVAAVTIDRLVAIRSAHFAGHADPSFSFEVARNIALGRGAVVDYAWHFRPYPTFLTHYAFDYWMPLPSLFMAAGLAAFGTRLVHALAVVVLMSMVLAVLAALVARRRSDDRLVPCIVAPLAITFPSLASRLVSTESTVFYAVLLATTFLCAVQARTRPAWWLAAGTSAGLTYLCRADGLSTAATVLFVSVPWTERRRHRAALGLTLAGILLVVVPLMVVNLTYLGRPTSTPPGVLTMTQYEDLYALPDDPTLASVFDKGFGWHASLRLDTLRQLAAQTRDANGRFTVFLGLGVVLFTCQRGPKGRGLAHVVQSPWLFPALNLVLLAAVWVVALPLLAPAGGWQRSLDGYAPFVLTAAVSGWLGPFGARWRTIRAATLAVMVLAAAAGSVTASRNTIRSLDAWGERFVGLRDRVQVFEACTGRSSVLMTRDPWEATEVLGARSIQIPNAPADAIADVIRRYKVTHVMTDARRPQLDSALLAALGFRAVDAGTAGVFEQRLDDGAPRGGSACDALR